MQSSSATPACSKVYIALLENVVETFRVSIEGHAMLVQSWYDKDMVEAEGPLAVIPQGKRYYNAKEDLQKEHTPLQ